jgi:hypothetical protein
MVSSPPPTSRFHETEETRPQRGRERREDRRRLEPQGLRREEQREDRRGRSPSCGELEECDHTDRRDTRERQGWRNNTHLGIVVHCRDCEVCKEYALHVYQHEFKLDRKYLDVKEHRNEDFMVESHTAVKRVYEKYEDEIDDLKDKIDCL